MALHESLKLGQFPPHRDAETSAHKVGLTSKAMLSAQQGLPGLCPVFQVKFFIPTFITMIVI